LFTFISQSNGFIRHATCAWVSLLGPCFKTGRKRRFIILSGISIPCMVFFYLKKKGGLGGPWFLFRERGTQDHFPTIFIPRRKRIDADSFETNVKWLFCRVSRAEKHEKGENDTANKRFFPGEEEKMKRKKKEFFSFSTSHLVRFPLNNFKFFELSFQSSLQLSLAVLVCYRAFVGIFSLRWNLPPILRLHSQTTRLKE